MFEELGAIAKDLIADLERARPGLPTDEAGFAEGVRARIRVRLGDLPLQYVSLTSPVVAARMEREIDDVLVPRYLSFALPFHQLERRGGGAWRGGDVYARLTLGAVGLAVGAFVVWAPFIPIWEKWVPVALALGFPLLPDLQKEWHLRKHRKKLDELGEAMENAGRALVETEPLDLLTGSTAMAPTGAGNVDRERSEGSERREREAEPVAVGGGAASGSSRGRREGAS